MGQAGLRDRSIALVTHGFVKGGGVPTVSRWLRDGLLAQGGWTVDIHDLATSSTDLSSRRLVAPRTWMRGSLRERTHFSGGEHQHWGANAVELEPMRYRPRRELIRALRQYDLIHVLAGTPAWGFAVARAGIPVVLDFATLVGWERTALLASQTGPMGIWRRAMTKIVSRLERSALQQVDAVLVMNREMERFTRSLGQSQVVFAPPGVDTSVFSPGGGEWNSQGHLLSVCRLGDPRKGLDRLIEAYALLVRRHPGTPPLVLAGRGNLPEQLSRLIVSLDVADRVIVRPDVEIVELLELYRTASVFLTGSHEEGLGMTVLEAMACGLPVVAAASAGTRESVVDGSTGWLVPPEPADRVVDRIATRAHSLLVGDGGAFGRRGRARCLEHFSTEVALRKVLGTYEGLLSELARTRHRSSGDRE